MVYIIKDNRILFDISTMKHLLKFSKVKIQRKLKIQNAEIVKYKNLHLYDEPALFKLMELIFMEKLEKLND